MRFKFFISLLLIGIIFLLNGCTAPTSTPVCGDGICAPQETDITSPYFCPQDCGIEQIREREDQQQIGVRSTHGPPCHDWDSDNFRWVNRCNSEESCCAKLDQCYNPKHQICCAGQLRNSDRYGCCGDKLYLSKDLDCCNWSGGNDVFLKATEDCCPDDGVISGKLGDKKACCGPEDCWFGGAKFFADGEIVKLVCTENTCTVQVVRECYTTASGEIVCPGCEEIDGQWECDIA